MTVINGGSFFRGAALTKKFIDDKRAARVRSYLERGIMSNEDGKKLVLQNKADVLRRLKERKKCST
jgi:hypothetical protein